MDTVHVQKKKKKKLIKHKNKPDSPISLPVYHQHQILDMASHHHGNNPHNLHPAIQ